MLFAVGCMSVLSLAFLGGVAAGRHWPRWLPMLAGAAPRAERELPAGPAGEARPGDRMRGPEPAPLLTFYHELTAPLTAPPPPKPRGADKPAPAKPRPAAAAGDADARSASATILVAPPGLPDGPRYAVQVGAFRERGPAETMRATLAGVGWDAYLAEIQGPDVVRYRVRVGSYATRDEARQAADRLSSERRLSTYVTAR
jgi:DedD protein